MAVNLSLVGGAAAQFFDNNGAILSGGKIYTYSAGTTTNQATYTTSSGNVAHTNPIILDSSGRVPGGEIWTTETLSYKFIIKTSDDVLIGTYDNIRDPLIAASNVSLTGFNGQTGTVENLVGDDGADWIGYTPEGVSAVPVSIQNKLRQTVSVIDFGADPTGVANSADAISAALTIGGIINFPPGTYKIENTVTIGSNVILEFGAAQFTFDTGVTPLFSIDTETDIVLRGGKFQSGTASAFLSITGTGTGASVPGTYAKNIWLENIYIESDSLEWVLDMSDSVRHVFVDNCYWESNNGVKITNKSVEVSISNSFIFRNGGAATTYGLYITAPAGGAANSEGLNITNTTVDFFEVGMSVADMYQMSVSQGFFGGTTKAIQFAQPTSTIGLLDFVFQGVVFNDQVVVGPFASGKSVYALFNGCFFETTADNDPVIDLLGNAYNVTILGCQFVNNPSSVGVYIKNNSGDHTIKNNFFDATHTYAVYIAAAAADGNTIRENTTPLTNAVNDLHGANVASNGLTGDISGDTLTGTAVTAGNQFGTGNAGFFLGNGQKGFVTVTITATNTSNGVLELLQGGTGSSITFDNGSSFVLPVLATGETRTFTFPFHIGADGQYAFGLENTSAGSVTLAAPSYISMTRL